ncbi:FtsJ-like methyltransferase-domain-containing protein [Polychytrium aggregatum]|uniref:FtsJ-like methyltransferase-domain-containing protein n=1 Tax=Polychytrium aggregatum TaxID=110093 RepID=UPI0022FDC6C1|nr:FtsJ-like methyltransferase-domain-containing protein [Polychytrium aggregatum]KAI9202063.1 FtsJ-like methyltransferase-domain-containing protein [Polychytrium aggregatum]
MSKYPLVDPYSSNDQYHATLLDSPLPAPLSRLNGPPSHLSSNNRYAPYSTSRNPGRDRQDRDRDRDQDRDRGWDRDRDRNRDRNRDQDRDRNRDYDRSSYPGNLPSGHDRRYPDASYQDAYQERKYSDPAPRPLFRAYDREQYLNKNLGWILGGQGLALDGHGYAKVFVEKIQAPNYDLFCDADVVQQLLDEKSKLGHVHNQARLVDARRKASPYVLGSKSRFWHPGAVVLANLNYLADVLHAKSHPFRFVDLSADYGGFTEYILWEQRRRNGSVHGWKMTSNVAKESEALRYLGSLDSLNLTLCQGADRSGSCLSYENIESLVQLINPHEQPIDLVVSDREDHVRSNMSSEDRIKLPLLSRVLAMFRILREGGTFVCKIYNAFLPFTCDLIFILHQAFEKITIVKPTAGTPDGSERYLICVNLKHAFPADLISYLAEVQRDIQVQNRHGEVESLLERSLVEKNTKFIDWIQSTNMKIAVRQAQAIKDILECLRQPDSLGYHHQEIQHLCYSAWGII